MPFDLLSAGLRIWTAVKGARIKAAHLNELQDQLRSTLGDQAQAIPIWPAFGDAWEDGVTDEASWEWVDANYLTDPPEWRHVVLSGGGAELFVPISGLRGGHTLTALYACVTGSTASPADSDAGSIYLVRRATGVTLGAWATITQIGGATPWPSDNTTVNRSATGLAVEVNGLYEYALRFVAPTNANPRTVKVHGASMSLRWSY